MKEHPEPSGQRDEAGRERAGGFTPVGGTDRPRRRPALRTSVAVFALLMAMGALGISLFHPGGIGTQGGFSGFFRQPTAHEAYLMGLVETGLAETALGQAWMAAGQEVLLRPLALDLPLLEEGFFAHEEPSALGYRFTLRRGQRLTVRVEMDPAADFRLFMDLFRVAPDTLRPPVHVYAPDSGTELAFEPRRTGDYLLRIQPELLRGGRFRVMIRNDAALAFPVSGQDRRDIGSRFGDPRDGGRRAHHGVDIFAPRGTPVVATSEGYVTRVDTTEIGGRVVWLRDRRRGASVYYAHLNEILTRNGAQVRPGDTLGTVGNTGNARTTPPHLHFGLYFRGEGPYDPWDYLVQPPGRLEPVEVELAEVGDWARVRGDGIHLRDGPWVGSNILADLPRHTAVRVTGGVGSWYRVLLPDGTRGFVVGDLTERVGEPLWLETVAEARPVQSAPLPGAPVMDRITTGSDLPVFGTFGDFLYVRSPSGRPGWVETVGGDG